MAPVIRVAVSQPLGRTTLNRGSWDGKCQAVVLKSGEISGPRPFCARLQFRVTDYGPEMLFQGAIDEMRHDDKKADPRALAASPGFTGSCISTLETGWEIDVHFVYDTTAEIGLNDRVYTLKRR